MATRKPLFFNNTGGFDEEMAATDDIQLGGLAMSGDITMGSNKVTGLAAATASGDALSYAQAGASLAGLTLTAALAMGGNQINNLAAPTLASDAANKGYVDSVATGLDLKASVRVSPTADFSAYTSAGSGVGKTLTSPDDNVSHNTQDGVLLVVGNRVLITTAGGSVATPDADNGIYVVTTLADGAGQELVLTRATDADQNAEVTAGLFTFVSEGTANADTGWVLITNDTITLDTTALAFSQFSSIVAYTFDQGLSNTSGSIKVELDTDANAQGAGAAGGSSGLEFDVNSASGQLRAAVNATGGLERSASGLAVLLNGTTLQSGASGLSVKGLPSLFEINAVAVGATVTAANLDTLTNGSNADALHIHAAAPATEAPKLENTTIVDESIAVADPVYWTSTANRVGKALANTDAKSLVVGLARTAQATAGQTLEMVSAGTAAGTLTGATPGTTYWLQAAGGIGTSIPAGGNRIIQVGIAQSATDLWVRIIDFGKKAA